MKTRLKTLSLSRFALAGVLLLSLLRGSSAVAQDALKNLSVPHLTVMGQGDVKVKPDKMEVTLGVVTEDKSSQAAARGNAEAAQRVQAAVKKAGIADKDVQTVNYSVTPVYSDSIPTLPGVKQQLPHITGYRVYNQVRIIVRDLAKMSDVLDGATAAGSNTIEGISLGLEDQKAAEGQALESAVLDARHKADHLAKAAGTSILNILELSDNTGYSRPLRSMTLSRRLDAGGATTPIAPGELIITANVTIIYGISQFLKP
jgi:uncharacterized protein YggE